MTASKLADLRQAFGTDEWPIFDDLTSLEQASTVLLTVPADLRSLRGHFPEQAVLPGVVQVHWAALLGQYLYPFADPFSHIDNLKFHHVILPAARVSLTLTTYPSKRALAFTYRHQETPCSEGKLVFAGHPND